jgi:hypothetical protein
MATNLTVVLWDGQTEATVPILENTTVGDLYAWAMDTYRNGRIIRITGLRVERTGEYLRDRKVIVERLKLVRGDRIQVDYERYVPKPYGPMNQFPLGSRRALSHLSEEELIQGEVREYDLRRTQWTPKAEMSDEEDLHVRKWFEKNGKIATYVKLKDGRWIWTTIQPDGEIVHV